MITKIIPMLHSITFSSQIFFPQNMPQMSRVFQAMNIYLTMMQICSFFNVQLGQGTFQRWFLWKIENFSTSIKSMLPPGLPQSNENQNFSQTISSLFSYSQIFAHLWLSWLCHGKRKLLRKLMKIKYLPKMKLSVKYKNRIGPEKMCRFHHFTIV